MDGYVAKYHNRPVKRYCQALDLREQPELIAEYRRLHSKECIQKEILDGIRQVGILEMEIYIHGNHLFMIIETSLEFRWDEAMAKLAALPGQAEWEDRVALYQKVMTGSTSAEKWQKMERIFYLYE